MLHHRLLILGMFIAASTLAYAGDTLDTLEQYAQKCDQAIGVTVPDFNCDRGTLVPTTHLTPANARYPVGVCDRPNVLNRHCDPGSRFQVLKNDEHAYVVAHCRKTGLSNGHYSDIAVIQHNKDNGATCFYQSDIRDLDGSNVKAPSKGTNNGFWMKPDSTARICVSCHDNGPIIRSPYLSQVKGPDGRPLLPGAGDNAFNRNQPYSFVGTDFESVKAYKVEVSGNLCNTCHRMGVNNLGSGGTARDLGIRATAAMQDNKNPHSADSPIWMLPGQVRYSQATADAAKAIKACADQFKPNSPLPNSPACKITQFTDIRRPANETWYVRPSQGGADIVEKFGVATDRQVSGDYDGDGKTDLAVFRPADETWYVRPSQGGADIVEKFGVATDRQVPGDYDGDGKTDLAVFRPADETWYVRPSQGGADIVEKFGVATDRQVPGDYDGDGKTDFAVFRPADETWYVRPSQGGTDIVEKFGVATDRQVPGDYDGDGKTDFAVFRP